MPEQNRNPLRQNAINQLLKGVSDTVKDQAGFIADINNGIYTAQLVDGSVVRNVLPSDSLTNANLGINTPVYIVFREGVPLIDSVQTVEPEFTGVEQVLQVSELTP